MDRTAARPTVPASSVGFLTAYVTLTNPLDSTAFGPHILEELEKNLLSPGQRPLTTILSELYLNVAASTK